MGHRTHLALKAIFNPCLIIVFLLRRLPLWLGFELRLEIDAVDRPYYAYGLMQAALQAKGLGLDCISVIEFGVARGAGLIAMERLARQVAKIAGVKIEVYGFDLATGLPSPADYRDLPFIWQKNFYEMDKEALTARLYPSTNLIIGDVSETIPVFAKENFAPIGFIAFDMDFYSSTKAAFAIFEVDSLKLLPRVFCFFDDVVGGDAAIMSEYTGELLAINEFNSEHKDQKIDLIPGLRHKRIIQAAWPDMTYVHHKFNHPTYNQYLNY